MPTPKQPCVSAVLQPDRMLLFFWGSYWQACRGLRSALCQVTDFSCKCCRCRCYRKLSQFLNVCPVDCVTQYTFPHCSAPLLPLCYDLHSVIFLLHYESCPSPLNVAVCSLPSASSSQPSISCHLDICVPHIYVSHYCQRVPLPPHQPCLQDVSGRMGDPLRLFVVIE